MKYVQRTGMSLIDALMTLALGYEFFEIKNYQNSKADVTRAMFDFIVIGLQKGKGLEVWGLADLYTACPPWTQESILSVEPDGSVISTDGVRYHLFEQQVSEQE